MARTIQLNEKELNALLTDRELALGMASRTLTIFNDNHNQKELILNYEGQGYRPVKVTIEFEYDESINFSEGDD